MYVSRCEIFRLAKAVDMSRWPNLVAFEVLFKEMANAMRRQALPQLAEAFAGTRSAQIAID
jgi:hypothetical protein